MPRIKNLPQCLYVMVAPTGECKIGVTTNAKGRLENINNAHPRGGVKLAFVSDLRSDMWAVEMIIHRRLSAKRLCGEWFDICEQEAVQFASSVLDEGIDSNPHKAMATLPPARVRDQNIVAEVKGGAARLAVARRYGISTRRVLQIMIRAGYVPRKQSPPKVKVRPTVENQIRYRSGYRPERRVR